MTPFEWSFVVGTTWQFEQANALESAGVVAPWFTCWRWTPATPVAEAVIGGAAAWLASAVAALGRPVVPWQEVQESLERSTAPSTCRSWLRMALAGLVAASVLS